MLLPNLPPELIIRILEYLGPVDVIRARMACKSIETASYDRNLWKNTFCDACSGHGVAEGTYDIPSMTRQELEHTTLRPYQFARHAFRSRGDIQPNSITALPLPSDLDFSHPDILLMPGGRFLFTGHLDQSISLWDINVLLTQNTDSTKLAPLANLHRDEHEELHNCSIEIFRARTTSDDKTIRAIIWACNASLETKRFYAYEISPTDKCPAFRLIRASTSRLGDACLDAFDGERATLETQPFDGRNAVWDLSTDSTLSWTSERLGTLLDYPPENGEIYASTVLLGNRFVRFKSIQEIAVYYLPIQPQASDIHSEVAPPRTATLKATATPLGNEPDSEVWYCVSQPQLCEQPSAPIRILEYIIHAPSNTFHMRLFLLDCGGTSPCLQEVSSITRSGVSFFEPVVNSPCVYCIGDSFAIHWIEDPAGSNEIADPLDILPFRFYVTEPSGSLVNGQLKGNHMVLAEMTRSQLGRDGGSSGSKVQFCSLSGRLVIQDEDGHIIIRDYYGT